MPLICVLVEVLRRGERVALDPVAAVPHLDPDEVAEVGRLDHVAAACPVLAAVPLVADLHDPLRRRGPPATISLPSSMVWLSGFSQYACLSGCHRGEELFLVVVVRRGDDDRVEVLVIEQLAVVAVACRFAAVTELVEDGLEGGEAELRAVGDRDEPAAVLDGLAHDRAAAIAAADEADVESLVRAEGARRMGRRRPAHRRSRPIP